MYWMLHFNRSATIELVGIIYIGYCLMRSTGDPNREMMERNNVVVNNELPLRLNQNLEGDNRIVRNYNVVNGNLEKIRPDVSNRRNENLEQPANRSTINQENIAIRPRIRNGVNGSRRNTRHRNTPSNNIENTSPNVHPQEVIENINEQDIRVVNQEEQPTRTVMPHHNVDPSNVRFLRHQMLNKFEEKTNEYTGKRKANAFTQPKAKKKKE